MTPSPSPRARRISGFSLGMLLAIANVIVISIGMGAAAGEGGIAVFVFMFTIIPAVITGAILGALADAFATRHVIVRFGVFGTLAIAMLAGLASSFHLGDLVPYAAVPTFVAVIALEYLTRRPRAEPIPVATVR
jgi:hypothetical protein